MADATALAAATGLQTVVAEGAPLDLHEGITDPATGCLRWPAGCFLRSSLGELVPGRCRATNLCGYCAKLAAVENSELLWLDALNGEPPTIWAVLTTPSTQGSPAAFYRDREAVIRALRRRWPGCEWAALVEFTTGYGARSGGRRRPHWNLFLKGVPSMALDEARRVIVDVWCGRQGASAQAQNVERAHDVAAVIRYVALHFQKESQRPPDGWKGHRFLKSRGYLWLATPQAREQAQASLRLKRELNRAIERGLQGQAAQEAAEGALLAAAALTWEFVKLGPPEGVSEGQKAASALRGVRSLDRRPDAYYLAEWERLKRERAAA